MNKKARIKTKKIIADTMSGRKEKWKKEVEEQKISQKKLINQEQKIAKKKLLEEERAAKRAKYLEKLRSAVKIAPLHQHKVRAQGEGQARDVTINPKKLNMFDEFRWI